MDMLESQRGSKSHWDLVPDWIWGEENQGPIILGLIMMYLREKICIILDILCL